MSGVRATRSLSGFRVTRSLSGVRVTPSLSEVRVIRFVLSGVRVTRFLSGVRVARSFRFLCCAFVFVVVCLVGFSFRSVSCTQCCLFWAVHSGLPLRFSLTFICTQFHVLSIHGN